MKHCTVPFFIAHRGCPHRCVFCDQLKISGSTNQFPSADEILDTVSVYRNSAGRTAVEVAFFGGSFTCLSPADQELLLLPLQPLLAAGEVSGIRVSTRPDAVDAQNVAFLKSMGVATVELGVQSMADDVLQLSGRGHGRNAVLNAVACLQAAGLTVVVQLMPGLPGDTPEKALDSLRDILVLKPDFLRIYPTLVIAGTGLEKLYAEGSYRPLTLDGAIALCKIMLHAAAVAGIPVIRMGLQPTAELQAAGAIVSGPYHPAFRQLVEGELCFDLLQRLADTLAEAAGPFTIVCSPSRVSDVIGQRKTNMRRISGQYGIQIVAVKADPGLCPWELRVIFSGGERTAHIIKDLDYSRENITHV
jgi:histone acetyltransferase (RNA polymerase elongator complex component)